jgi:hypothetical protein
MTTALRKGYPGLWEIEVSALVRRVVATDGTGSDPAMQCHLIRMQPHHRTKRRLEAI